MNRKFSHMVTAKLKKGYKAYFIHESKTLLTGGNSEGWGANIVSFPDQKRFGYATRQEAIDNVLQYDLKQLNDIWEGLGNGTHYKHCLKDKVSWKSGTDIEDITSVPFSANIKRKKSKNGPDPIIHQYIRKANGKRVGVMVGTIKFAATKDIVMLGWSMANINAGDKFDPKRGLKLATERLNAIMMVPVPHSIVDDMYSFQDRCFRYFKIGGVKLAIQMQPQPKQKVKATA